MSEMKELRGVECVVTGRGQEFHAYVVHADRDKGITLHDIETDKEIWCLDRKHLLTVRIKTKDKNRVYHEAFTEAVQGILAGKLGDMQFNKDGRCHVLKYNPSVAMLPCAFK